MTTEMKRFYFRLRSTQQWYAIMQECRQWFGSNWRGQPRVRRKLPDGRKRVISAQAPCLVWFDVPDERFASWIAVKMALEVVSESKLKAAK